MTRVLLTALLDDPSLVTVVSSPKVAEMSKLAENTYRAVNIAYVNELAMLAHEMDVDIWEVMEAAATKPFGFQPFLPGIGPGGQCIPVNPYYISWKAREFDFHTSFIELAGDINLRMTNYVMHRIHSFTTRLGLSLSGAKVLCLGAAFKAGVSDVRNSRAVRVMELLDQEGADVSFADPLVASADDRRSRTARRCRSTASTSTSYDLVVVLVRNPAWDVDSDPRARCADVRRGERARRARRPAPTNGCDPTGPLAHQGSRSRWRGTAAGRARGGGRPRAVHLRGRVRPRLEAAPRAGARGARRAHPLPRSAATSSIPAGRRGSVRSSATERLRRRPRALARSSRPSLASRPRARPSAPPRVRVHRAQPLAVVPHRDPAREPRHVRPERRGVRGVRRREGVDPRPLPRHGRGARARRRRRARARPAIARATPPAPSSASNPARRSRSRWRTSARGRTIPG